MIRTRKTFSPALELLEDRSLPSAVPFAALKGTAATSASKSIQDIELVRGDFNSKSGQVLVAVKVQANQASTLNPGNIRILFNGTRPFQSQVHKLNLIGDNASYLLVSLPFGKYRFEISPEGQTAGSFTTTFSLAGDLNSDGAVNSADLTVLQKSMNRDKRSSLYNPDADLDQNGVVNLADKNLINKNLGISTTIRQLTLGNFAINGSTQSAPFDFQVRQTSVVFTGHANPNQRVSLDKGADGTVEQTTVANRFGEFQFTLVGLTDVPTLYRLTTADRFGQKLQQDIQVTKTGVVVNSISPSNGTELVSLTRETVVRFSAPVNPATINPDSFYLIAKGDKVPGTIHVAANHMSATYFYTNPLPESTEVRVYIDGDKIKDAQGYPVDADNDGVDGGKTTADFSTLPLTLIPGTTLWGVIRSSYEHVLDVNGQPLLDAQGKPVFKPISGVTVSLDANPAIFAVTDANGLFELGLQDLNQDGTADGLPAPEFFVHIDGSTATGAPAGTAYATLGKAFHNVPGQRTRLNMMGVPFDIYLPTMTMADIVPISPTAPTNVGLANSVINDPAKLAELFPNLTPAQRALLSEMKVTFPAGSAREADGTLADRGMIVPVNPQFLPAPLPPNVNPGLVVSIQAGTANGFNLAGGNMNFDTPAPVTFPNLEGLPAGEKSLIWSFDHDQGKWTVIGTGTVSADGKRIVSDPGTGVLAPGWHFTISGSRNFELLAPNNGDKDYATYTPGPLDIPGLLLAESSLLVPLGASTIGNGFLYIAQLLGVPAGDFTFTSLHLANFLANTGAPLFYPDGSLASDKAKEDPSVISFNNSIQNIVKTELNSRIASGSTDTDIQVLLNNSIANVRFQTADLFFAIAGTQGVRIEGSVDVDESGGYSGELTYTFADTYGYGRDDAMSFAWPDRPARALQEAGWARPFRVDLEVTFPISSNALIHRSKLAGVPTSFSISSTPPISTSTGFGTDGKVYYRYEFENGVVLNGVSNSQGVLDDIITPSNKKFKATYYSPSTNRWTSHYSVSTASGSAFGFEHAGGSVFLENQGGYDQDNDGIPDVGERAIGTNPNNRDSDNDGISDDSELTQGLNPLDGVAFPTGVISSLAMPGNPEAVTVADNLVYVATGSHGLAIIDGSKFDRPIILGQIDLDGNATDVAVDTTRKVAAVATGFSLHLVDVSDPMLPKDKKVVVDATSVEAMTDYIFAAYGNKLRVLDSTSGELLASLNLPGSGSVTDLAREGSRLYAFVSGSDTLVAIDISRPDHPLIAGQLNVSIASQDIGLFAGNNTVWLAGSGLRAVDASNPAAMALVGQPHNNNDFFTARRVALNGSGLALITPDGGNTVTVNNVSDRTRTGADQLLTSFNLSGAINDIVISRGIAYAAVGNRLEVINYRPFDTQGQAPSQVILTTNTTDADPNTAGLQLLEGGVLSVLVEARDDVQVRSVDLLVNGNVVQTDVSFPFDFSTFIPNISLGSTITIQARATDTGGNVTLSSPLVVGVVPDTFAPAIIDVNPSNGAIKGEGLNKLRVRFSERMDPTGLVAANFVLAGAGADNQFGNSDDVSIPVQNFEVKDNDTFVQLSVAPLAIGKYALRLNQSALKDVAGNSLGTGISTISFQTVEVLISNGGFDDGTLQNWEVPSVPGGSIAVLTTHTDSGVNPPRTYNPIDGSNFAYLESADNGSYTQLLQSFTAKPGDILSGWSFFDTTDYLPFNDFAEVRVLQNGIVIATLFEANIAGVGNYGGTPWTEWSYAFTTGGTFTLEARVTNDGDSVVESYLGLDAIKLLRM